MLARITGKEAGFLEFRPEFPIEFDQRTGNAQPDCIGLACHTTAVGENQNIELVGHLSDEKRLTHRDATGFSRKIIVERTTVDGYIALTRSNKYAGDRGLAATGPEVLLNLSCWHS